MITKYASAIQDYDKLFTEANARLKELGVTDAKIGDLQSYFSHLRDLVYGPNDILNTGKPEDIVKIEAGYKFLKLPLDEPHLIINANQRTIDTKSFTDAGGVLSVQGDEISEIVFFEVDRYFDSTDLSQMQIAIQWKNKQDEGSTPAFIRIVQATKDNLDEKLIFGWPITSEVTKAAGAVQFSVRFYDRVVDSEEFNYSLVTLPATLNIGASLSAILDEDSMDDPRPTILSRLSNSRILGGSEYAIAPVFVYPYREGVSTAPIQVDFGNKDNTSYLLQAMARKDGSKGSVTYKWYKSPLDEDNWEGLDTQNDPNDLWKPGLEENNSYILVTSWHDDFEELSTFYYQKEEDGKIVYKTCSPIASKEAFENNLKSHNNKLYIRGTSLQLNISPDTSVLGKYCVDSRVGFIGTYAYASGANPLDDGEFLGTTNLDNLPMWIVEGPKVVVLNQLNDYYDLRQETLNNRAVLSGENLDDTTSYSWYYSPSSRENDFQLLDGEKNSELTINNEGYYYAVATNYKNGESNSSETPVTVAYSGIKGYSKDNVQIQNLGGNQFKIIVNNDEAGIEENLSYNWNAFGQSAALGSIETILVEDGDICTFSEDIEIFYIQVNIVVEKGKTKTNEAFEVYAFDSNLVSLEDMV